MRSNDVEANEATRLVPYEDDEDDDSLGDFEIWNDEAEIIDETTRAWPATFERSINLLSSPMVRAEQVEHFTKSPLPGLMPQGEIRRRQTMQPVHPHEVFKPKVRLSLQVGAHMGEFTGDDFDEDDFEHAKEDLLRLSGHEKKAKDAKDYRAKILQQQKAPSMRRVSVSMNKKRASISLNQKRASVTFNKKPQEVSEEPEDMDGATTAQCVFNLSNILMGVGLLTLPYTCKVAGTIGGSIAITCLALITWRTSILIGRSLNGDPRPLSSFKDSPWKTPLKTGSTPEARMRKPISGFPDIAREAFGNFGSVVLAIVLYFELFSCIGIFLVSIGDHIHTLFPYHPVTVYMVGAAIFAAIPVILLRTARLLSYLSMVGTFATVCVVSSVVFSYVLEGDITERIAKHMPDSEPPFHGSFRPDGLPLAFGLCAYCFSGHAIVPSIFNSMQRPQDFEKVVNISFSIVLLCSFGVGLSGYFMFGDFVEDQVTLSLESYSSFQTAMTILTYLMILTAFSKLALTMFPLALGMEEIFTPYLSTEKGVAVLSIVIKVVLLFGALMVAIFFPSFSLLCSMVGMICTMAVSAIFPAAAYIKLFGAKIGIFEKVLYGFFVLIGVAIAVVGTFLSIE